MTGADVEGIIWKLGEAVIFIVFVLSVVGFFDKD